MPNYALCKKKLNDGQYEQCVAGQQQASGGTAASPAAAATNS
jgi:hypothetical protein